jgi:hypothetical protein
MSIISTLRREESQGRAAAAESYRQIVRRIDAPQDGDASLLRQAMATLGLTVDHVDYDARALREVARLEAGIAPRERITELADVAARSVVEAKSAFIGKMNEIFSAMDLQQVAAIFNSVSAGSVCVTFSQNLAEGVSAAQGAHAAAVNANGHISASVARIKDSAPRVF